VPKVGALTAFEAADFFAVYALLEDALERVLGADLVNLSCLRNWAYREVDPEPPYRDGFPNPHVHWHVAPRFGQALTFAGETFIDVDFGDELSWTGRRLDRHVRRELITAIRGALPITFEPPSAP
jgi:diadenosine tetraphosphate (Ap4A) HIT family hydrolase